MIFVKKIMIDEDRIYTLTKYATNKGTKKNVLNDHNHMFATFNMEYNKLRNICLKRNQAQWSSTRVKRAQQHPVSTSSINLD